MKIVGHKLSNKLWNTGEACSGLGATFLEWMKAGWKCGYAVGAVTGAVTQAAVGGVTGLVVSGLCPIAAPYATWVGLGLGTIAAFRGGSDVLRQEFSPSKSMTTWRLTRGLPKLTACIVGTIGAVAAVPIGAACLILAGAFKLLGNLFHLTGSAKGAIPQSVDDQNDTMAPG